MPCSSSASSLGSSEHSLVSLSGDESSLSSLDSEDELTSEEEENEDVVQNGNEEDYEDSSFERENESFINDIKDDAPQPLSALEMRLRTGKELEMIATLVPARLLFAHMNNTRGKHRVPRGAIREEFDGAVLFADISGFSKLAESLVARTINASNAAENLVKYVGWNLNEMVEVICNAGGDCMKFAGDAILAVFAADEFNGSLPEAAYRCAQAALALQNLQLNAAHEARLSIHSGMGVGRVATYEVGGVLDRWEIFVAGSPVEQIGRCEPLAKSGELVVSFESRICIERISKIQGEMVEGGDFRLDKLLDVLPNRPVVPSPAQYIERLAQEDPERAQELKRILMKYVSRPVIFSIEGHAQSLWGAELRDCSTLFCKFKGLNFSENSEEDLAVVQYVVKNVVQKVMQNLEGTVCRFMVDDKGASMLLAFGLVPYAHVNDCVRAVKAALLIRDGVAALSLLSKEPESVPAAIAVTSTKLERTSRLERRASETIVTSFHGPDQVPIIKSPISCQIGITHGRVCVGMVGGTTRCEYTLHGVLVNRAARLMGLATDGVVLCDFDAYSRAKKEVEFDPHPTSHRLKGERKEVQVFKALRKASGQSVANTKTNPSISSSSSLSFSGLLARSEEKIATDEYLSLLNGELPWSGVIGITGETGIGKSLMLQHVAKRAQSSTFRTTVLSGFALDTETSAPFFAWKNMVIQLVAVHANLGQTMPSSSNPSQSQPSLHAVASKETVLSSSNNNNNGGASPPLFASKQSFKRLQFADMTPEERRECLIEALPREKREYYPLLAPFVDEMIPTNLLEDNDTSGNIVRAQRSAVAMETVVSMLTNFATLLHTRNERLILVLDDIQWLDELSLELLNLVSKTMPRLGIFVAFSQGTKPVPCLEVWELERLELSDLAQCMQLWLKAPKVNESCVQFLFERTDGNPLFSEELCALMVEKKFFEVANGTCALRMVPDSESLNLTASIQSIMTTSLDRLSASQQIVVRVVAMMGMQCTLQDLGGVFREINERSTNKLMDKSFDAEYGESEDEGDDPGGYFSLADMLKQGLEEPKAKEQKEPHEIPQRLVALFTSINVESIITSLVDKGILEAKQYGSRTVYVFRHLLMKSTCLAGLRSEVKQMLHTTIALYYESRPTNDLLAWYTILAEHFFKAKRMKMKALKYLQLAGGLACETHANQQVFSIYRRLIELNHLFADEIAVSDLNLAQWHRKVAESLFHLNETYHAERLRDVERHLFKALTCLGLDIRLVDGMSGTEAGFLLPQTPTAAAAAVQTNRDSRLKNQSSLFRVNSFPCMRTPSSSDVAMTMATIVDPVAVSATGVPSSPPTLAEDVVVEIPGRRPPPTRMDSLLRSFSLVTMRDASQHGEYVNGDCAEDVEPFIGEGEFSVVEDASPRPSLMFSPGNGGGSGSGGGGNSAYGVGSAGMAAGAGSGSRRRSLLLTVEPTNTAMRPRLVLSLNSFRRLKREALQDTNGEVQNDAIESLLEAGAAYDMLSTLQRDRCDVVALERRLNCILLAEAAASAFAKDPAPKSPPMITPFGRRTGLSRRYTATTLGNNLGAMLLPKSGLQQRSQDELSKAYSRAALFFAGMKISTRWRSLGSVYAQKANEFLKQNRQDHQQQGGARMPRFVEFDSLSTSEYSENFVNLHRRCGEWDVIQGNFIEAKDKLRYAVWGAKFMHLESMFDTKALELAVFFFNGDLDSCNRNASDLFEKNTPPKFVAIGARFMALCGAYDVATHKLIALAASNSHGAAAPSSDNNLNALEFGLKEFDDPNALLALSLVAWRVERNAALAVRAGVLAAECALRGRLLQVPIILFHELALCFTALWDPIRDNASCVGGMLGQVQLVLERLTQAVRSFALVYRVCRPHAKYCFAVREKIRRVLSVANGGEEMSPLPAQMAPLSSSSTPAPAASGAGFFALCASTPPPPQRQSQALMGAATTVTTVAARASDLGPDPFRECAQFAQTNECFWVQGLALLEIDSVEDWFEATKVFAAYEHASYELARCDKRLKEAQRSQTPNHAAAAAAAAIVMESALPQSTSVSRNSATRQSRNIDPEEEEEEELI
ncbi:hypothetical protein BASA81_000673 [Batrachochytrium salamandrivorans]|nr:hypothetical protein BASA81_000673 [Batrachochytrium salamandrivorans]